MSTEKESTGNRDVEKCAVILLDIAGTTTSNSFIKDTLFPFAVSNAEEYLKSHWNEEVVKDAVKQLNEYSDNISVSEVAEIIKTATEKDEDNKGVKTLQGLIYRQGYEDGKLKAPVFPDVSSSLESWSKNHRVAIYSSGSIESQKLLFAHTAEGDLSASIAQYFDLSVGLKAEVSSYEKIAKELAVAPAEIVYINDDVEEARAASQAGLKSILIIREGNANIPEEKQKEFKVIKSFADLSMEVSGKRKIEEEETAEEPPTKVAKTEEPKEGADEEKNVIAQEEPMEIDSTNEIKDAKTGESELESAANKDENVMETDVKVNAENEKTEIETEQREDALNEAIQKSEAEITKSVGVLESHQTNSDSIEKTPDSSEKFEGFSKKDENVSSEVLADSTEKLTDSVDKVKDKPTTELPLTGNAGDKTVSTEKLTDSVDKMEEPPLVEIGSAAVEKGASETDTTEKPENAMDKMEDIITTELPLTGIASTVIERESSETDAIEKLSDSTDKKEELTTKPSVTEIVSTSTEKETDSTEKLADPVDKMEDILTTEFPPTGIVSTIVERVSSNTDSTEKLTDCVDKMEDVQTTEPPQLEIVDKVIEKDTSKTDSAEEPSKSVNKEDKTTKPPLTGNISTVIEGTTSKTDSTEKLADSVEKMEDILTTEPPQKEVVCEVVEKDTSRTESTEKLTERDTPETVNTKTGNNSTTEERITSENDKVENTESKQLREKSKDDGSEFHIEISEADDGGNKEAQSEVVDKEMDTQSTDTETKTADEETGDVLMEVCETTVDKIEEQNKTNKIEERHNKCKNICNKENSESSKAESAHINNEEIKTSVTQGDDIESITTNTGAPVQAQECTSNEVRNECEKKKEEVEPTESTSTEKNAVDCEMKEIDGTEDKVNGNEAESSRSDEKENKSELANGTTSVETGSDVNENGDVANATEEEIKVKKLEENPDSTAVSVEA